MQPTNNTESPPPPDANPTSAHQTYLNTKHFQSLDGLRALAILAVLLHHADPAPFITILSRGFLGVDLFFVISGFLIVTLLLREKQANHTISLRRFYIRRSLRIFPVYYALLITLAALYLIARPDSPNAQSYFHELPYLFTYTANWIHLSSVMFVAWSLAAEEQFYLLWPPLTKLLKPIPIYIALAALLIINQLINYQLIYPLLDPQTAQYLASLHIMQSTFTPILLGVALAHLLHEPKSHNILRPILAHRATPFAALLTLFALANIPTDLAGTPRLAIHLTMTLLLASTVIRTHHPLHTTLTLTPLKRIGIVSYGIYLFHMLTRPLTVKALATLHIDSPFTLFALNTLLAYLAAELSYRFFESHFLRFKTRFAATPNPTSRTTPPPPALQ